MQLKRRFGLPLIIPSIPIKYFHKYLIETKNGDFFIVIRGPQTPKMDME